MIEGITAKLDEVGKSAAEAGEGFKKMQIVLLVFCALVTVAIVLIAIKTVKE